MIDEIEEWKSIPLAKFEAGVFHLQRQIFCSSLRGDRTLVHRLQKLLLRSFKGRCLAVARVTEQNTGKDTPGVDGQRALTDTQKLALAHQLRLDEPIVPVRRVRIPKPGSPEKRPLGIPTLRNRALQALMVLALEPEWECRFGPGTFGFRKGRGCHDALASIRGSISRRPKWVLDADIEKVFDRVNHEALLNKLETFPAMNLAIRRILKSGSLEGNVWTPTAEGTPQGGVLSPLLANIALCGLEDAITNTYREWKLANGKSPRNKPTLAFYADDFVVLHADREIVKRCRDFIAEWLQPLGLALHPAKTRIVHTLDQVDGETGFDFLGHHIRQYKTGKYAVKACFKQVYTHIKPSKAAVKRAISRTNEIIETTISGKGDGGTKSATKCREDVLIHRLNRFVTGWSNYFRHSNAKKTLSKLDHLIWWKLWRTIVRRYPRKPIKWIKDEFFNGEGQWRLTCRRNLQEKKPALRRFNETAVVRFYPVRTTKSFFDGDWAYWGARLGRYPCLPGATGMLLERQHGKCPECRMLITRKDRLTIIRTLARGSGEKAPRDRLVHWQCRSPSSDAGARLGVMTPGNR